MIIIGATAEMALEKSSRQDFDESQRRMEL